MGGGLISSASYTGRELVNVLMFLDSRSWRLRFKQTTAAMVFAKTSQQKLLGEECIIF